MEFNRNINSLSLTSSCDLTRPYIDQDSEIKEELKEDVSEFVAVGAELHDLPDEIIFGIIKYLGEEALRLVFVNQRLSGLAITYFNSNDFKCEDKQFIEKIQRIIEAFDRAHGNEVRWIISSLESVDVFLEYYMNSMPFHKRWLWGAKAAERESVKKASLEEKLKQIQSSVTVAPWVMGSWFEQADITIEKILKYLPKIKEVDVIGKEYSLKVLAQHAATLKNLNGINISLDDSYRTYEESLRILFHNIRTSFLNNEARNNFEKIAIYINGKVDKNNCKNFPPNAFEFMKSIFPSLKQASFYGFNEEALKSLQEKRFEDFPEDDEGLSIEGFRKLLRESKNIRKGRSTISARGDEANQS